MPDVLLVNTLMGFLLSLWDSFDDTRRVGEFEMDGTSTTE
jgi:hypothetical protein